LIVSIHPFSSDASRLTTYLPGELKVKLVFSSSLLPRSPLESRKVHFHEIICFSALKELSLKLMISPAQGKEFLNKAVGLVLTC